MRDTQRQRVYDAERSVPRVLIGTGSVDEVVEFVGQVVGSAWWRKRCTTGVVQVKDGRGRRIACAYGNTIKLPRWARSKQIVLHELAHILSDGDAPHGREFAAAQLALLDRFGEPGDGKILRDAYTAKRVKWRGATPRTIRNPRWGCHGCGKQMSRPMPWRLTGGRVGAESFCTKRCAEQWFADRLKRVAVAAAIRG